MMTHAVNFVLFLALASVCVSVSVPLGGTCSTDSDCKDLNAVCYNNNCTCGVGSVTVKEKAYCKTFIGFSCNVSESCPMNASCLKGYCQCDSGYKYISSENKCVIATVPIGGKCRTEDSCEDLNALCLNDTCICAHETVTNKGKTYCKAHGSRTRCEILEVCFEDSICYRGSCRCHFGYIYAGDSACTPRTGSLYKRCYEELSACPGYSPDRTACMNRQCWCRPEFKTVNTSAGYQCAHNASLHDGCKKWDTVVAKNAHCDNGQVVCAKGYRSGERDQSIPVCAKDKAADFGKSCQAHFQCLRKTKNSLCSNNTCTCPTDFHYKVLKNQVACMKSVKLGDYCYNYGYCKASPASCETGQICKCDTKQIKGQDRCAKPMSQGTITGIVLGVVAAIVVIALVLALYLRKRKAAKNEDTKRLTVN